MTAPVQQTRPDGWRITPVGAHVYSLQGEDCANIWATTAGYSSSAWDPFKKPGQPHHPSISRGGFDSTAAARQWAEAQVRHYTPAPEDETITVMVRLTVRRVPPIEGFTPYMAHEIASEFLGYGMETGNDDGAIVEWDFLDAPEALR